jgi:hypothetical protein
MSDDANEKTEKKIIIDEDWKSQVEAEKEELQRKQQEQEAAKPATETEAGTSEPAADADVPLPPPSLEFLASSLGMQAMIAMGLMPSPVTGKPEVLLHQAKHFIDTIAMLEEKTEGNRTPEESQEMDTILHQLRLAYVGVQEKQTKDEG